MIILETTTSIGAPLWIKRDDDASVVLFCLDCGHHSYSGKHFEELPRYYRSERGAKQAAALLTGERLTWVPPAEAN